MISILNKTLKAAASITTIVWTTASFAGQFYVLDIDKQMSRRNGNDTIKIRQVLKQQHGVKANGAELLSVMMVSKTKVGRGGATLLVGQSQSNSQTVGGTAMSFHSDDETTYDRTLFKNPKGNSNGKWQIKLRGNFMVKQVVVEIDPTILVPLNYNMHTRTGRGGQDTLMLKQAMKRQTSMIPRGYDLQSVTVIGKSKRGGGTATLKMGQALSDPATLAGTPIQFHAPGQWTYSKVTLDNPKGNSNGVWQIKLRGNIKIQQVILKLKKK